MTDRDRSQIWNCVFLVESICCYSSNPAVSHDGMGRGLLIRGRGRKNFARAHARIYFSLPTFQTLPTALYYNANACGKGSPPTKIILHENNYSTNFFNAKILRFTVYSQAVTLASPEYYTCSPLIILITLEPCHIATCYIKRRHNTSTLPLIEG